MKIKHTLILFALTLCLSVTLHAKTGVEKDVVKTEAPSSISDAVLMNVFSYGYIAEATQEAIPEMKPTLIGETSEGYVSKVYHPPVIKNNRPRYSGRRL